MVFLRGERGWKQERSKREELKNRRSIKGCGKKRAMAGKGGEVGGKWTGSSGGAIAEAKRINN